MTASDRDDPGATPRNASGVSARTRAVTAGLCDDPGRDAIMPPLYLSTAYEHERPGEKPPFDYGRTANPNRASLAQAIADLEGAAGGVVTSSGMAAIDAVLQLVSAGDLVVAPHDCYGGTYRLLKAKAAKGAFNLIFVDQNDEAALADALYRRPKLVLIETPNNPLLRIVDIEKTAAAAKDAGALVCVDNTFLSPARQQPIALGADIVVHSTTKYINGHSDVVGGVAVARAPAIVEELAWWVNCIGYCASPFDAYQTARGLRTLHLRLAQQEASAAAIANRLAAHPAVRRVYYPGLKDHPGHEIAARQQSGFGAILSFEVEGGLAASTAAVTSTRLFRLAPSLGGVESLVCLPWSMTHAGISEEDRRSGGVTEGLIRLSVGVEDESDLIADLEAALQSTA